MRCLTLAQALQQAGAECYFVCRSLAGNLVETIRQHGFQVFQLPSETRSSFDSVSSLAYESWLGTDWASDARETAIFLGEIRPDWLVVDHYALDRRWEIVQREFCRRVFIIDDLADRGHECELLLDQNLGRKMEDYAALVPAACSELMGPEFALIRPDFAQLREDSLQRRSGNPQIIRNLMISMGGIDQPNATEQVLDCLTRCVLPADCRIRIVMGKHAPWLPRVRETAQKMPWRTEVLIEVGDMARLMANSDLAIGAAGGTSWERCCLGVPTLLVVLADNQWPGAKALQSTQAAEMVGEVKDIASQLPLAWEQINMKGALARMSTAAGAITDGLGASRVLHAMGF